MVEFCYFYSSSYCTPYCQNVQEVYNNFVQDVHKKFTRYKKMEKNEPIRQKTWLQNEGSCDICKSLLSIMLKRKFENGRKKWNQKSVLEFEDKKEWIINQVGVIKTRHVPVCFRSEWNRGD